MDRSAGEFLELAVLCLAVLELAVLELAVLCLAGLEAMVTGSSRAARVA
ncbi:MAG TPA: hypothetical protein VIT65_17330 [Microlunatus sp.]